MYNKIYANLFLSILRIVEFSGLLCYFNWECDKFIY